MTLRVPTSPQYSTIGPPTLSLPVQRSSYLPPKKSCSRGNYAPPPLRFFFFTLPPSSSNMISSLLKLFTGFFKRFPESEGKASSRFLVLWKPGQLLHLFSFLFVMSSVSVCIRARQAEKEDPNKIGEIMLKGCGGLFLMMMMTISEKNFLHTLPPSSKRKSFSLSKFS